AFKCPETGDHRARHAELLFGTVEDRAIALQIELAGFLAAVGSELEIELGERLREETLLAVARDHAPVGRHAANRFFDRLGVNALGDSLALEIRNPAAEG